MIAVTALYENKDTPNYLLMSQAIALLCKLLLSITLEV